jgi:hypothetical protein
MPMPPFPNVPILILKRDHANYPWHVSDESGALLAIGRHPPHPGKPFRLLPGATRLRRQVIEFSSAAGDPLFNTERTRLKWCSVTRPDGSPYGVVLRSGRRSRRHDCVEYEMTNADGLVGRITFRPHHEPDRRLTSAPGQSHSFVSDRDESEVGQVFRFSNIGAPHRELHFATPIGPELAILCIAAETMFPA